MTLAEIIKKKRLEMGLKQCDLAEITGVTRVQLSRIENERTLRPNRNTLEKLSKALNLDLSEYMPPDNSEQNAARNLSYHMREYRKKTKRAKADIAAEIGISVQTYSRIETQRLKPSEQVLQRIADVLYTTAEQLTSKPVSRDKIFSDNHVALIVSDFRHIIKTMREYAAQYGTERGLTEETIQLAADCAAHIEIKKQAQRYAANMGKPFAEVMRIWREHKND